MSLLLNCWLRILSQEDSQHMKNNRGSKKLYGKKNDDYTDKKNSGYSRINLDNYSSSANIY